MAETTRKVGYYRAQLLEFEKEFEHLDSPYCSDEVQLQQAYQVLRDFTKKCLNSYRECVGLVLQPYDYIFERERRYDLILFRADVGGLQRESRLRVP